MRILSILFLAFVVGGCVGTRSSTFVGPVSGKHAQDEEMDFATPLKLKIERCYWASSLNKADDFDVPKGGYMPDMSVKPQDMFLVVEVVMTNYGSEPSRPLNTPQFVLKSPGGASYNIDPQFNGLAKLASLTESGGSINPERAVNGRAVFDVPKGTYDLALMEGRWVGLNQWRTIDLGWTWELTPTESN